MDALRVAVALIALQHKAPSQSIPSCVLDLQAAFSPAAQAADDFKCSPVIPLSSASPLLDGSSWNTADRSGALAQWRAHALHMENEAASLKAQLDAERVKNIVLENANAAAASGKTAAAHTIPAAAGLNGCGGASHTTAAPNPSLSSPLDPHTTHRATAAVTGGGSGGGAGHYSSGGVKKKQKKKQGPHSHSASASGPATPSGDAGTTPASVATSVTPAAAAAAAAQSDALACVMRLLRQRDEGLSPIEELTMRASPMAAITRVFQLEELFRSAFAGKHEEEKEEGRRRHPRAPGGTGVQPGGERDISKAAELLELLAASCEAAIDSIGLELGSVVSSATVSGGGSARPPAVNGSSILPRAFEVYAVVLEHLATSVFPLFSLSSERVDTCPDAAAAAAAAGNQQGMIYWDRCLRALSKRVWLPCVRSFVPMSECLLMEALRAAERDGDGNSKDLRYSMVSLLRTVFTALFSSAPATSSARSSSSSYADAYSSSSASSSSASSSSAQSSLMLDSLRMGLTLDTLTELNRTLFADSSGSRFREGFTASKSLFLDAIWDSTRLPHPRITSDRGSAAASPSPPSRDGDGDGNSRSRSISSGGVHSQAQARRSLGVYERHLARKDGLWFLCSVLHLLSSFDGLYAPDAGISTNSSNGFKSSSSSPPSATTTASAPSPSAQYGVDNYHDLTYERMRKGIVKDTLQLLSKCTEECVGNKYRHRNCEEEEEDEEQEEQEQLRLSSKLPSRICVEDANANATSGTGTTTTTATTTTTTGNSSVHAGGVTCSRNLAVSHIDANAMAATAGGEASCGASRGSSTSTSTLTAVPATSEGVGRRGSGSLDEAEYAMVLGAAERVLLVYGG